VSQLPKVEFYFWRLGFRQTGWTRLEGRNNV
jgi:hypothetical protein